MEPCTDKKSSAPDTVTCMHCGAAVHPDDVIWMGDPHAVRYLRRQPHELILLTEGEILLLHSDGEQERCQFRLHPACYSRFGMWNDWTRYGDLPRKRRGCYRQLQDDLLATAANLGYKRRDIQLVSNKESIDSGTATGKLMLTMIGAINEFERQNLLEGIQIAKANGRYKGRCPVRVDSEKFRALRRQYLQRQLTKAAMARKLGISRPTLDKLLQEPSAK